MSSGETRSMPADLEAERAILGAILLDNEAINSVAETLNVEDFYGTGNQHVYRAMLDLRICGRPIDEMTLVDILGNDVERAGGLDYIAALGTGLPRKLNVAEYGRIVKEKAIRRQLMRACQDIGTAAHRGDGPLSDLVAELEAAAMLISPNGTAGLEVRSLAEILTDPHALDPPTAVIPRLAWRGRVTLLAAREKGGKSTLLTAAAGSVTRGSSWLGDQAAEGDVLWIALEEHVADLATRMSDWGADPERVHIVDSLATAGDPLAAIHAAATKLRPSLVVIDTLAALAGLLDRRPEFGSSTDWTPVMTGLARIARETDAALVLPHHARKSDGAYRDSSAIGAGVDVIIEMSEDSHEDTVRRLRVRARWPVGDYGVRLVGTRYELAAGELSLDARVLLRIEANPGCSMRVLRDGVNGRAASVKAVLEQLIERGAVEDRGTERCASLHAVGGGSQGGSRPGTAKNRDAVPNSGSAPVPIGDTPEPLPLSGTGSPLALLRERKGNRPGNRDEAIEL